MCASKIDIATIKQLHQAGKLREAKQGYLFLLKENPKNVEALHGLAILNTQEDNLTNALRHINNAIDLQPKNAILYLHLANILKIQGLFDQAANVLHQIIELDPDCISAYNNLGSLCFAQKNFADAVFYYREALKHQPDYVDAHYNLGLALAKNNEIDTAANVYENLLQNAPEHFAARFHFACILMQQSKFSQAEKNFLIIQEAHPFHFETQTNLATCYLKLGALATAKKHYLNALELSTQDTQVLFNLGVIDTQLGNLDSAIQYYQRAIQANQDYFEAHNNLGTLFIMKQHAGLALQHFSEALRLQPNNAAIRYTVEALSKNQRLMAAPSDYITTLFDAYADHYDAHLTQALEYKIPALLHAAIKKSVTPPIKQWHILDLGCGTGLCGTPFTPYAKTLVGVDLSNKMLEFAKEKNIYTELFSDDLTHFLAANTTQYDLIIAGDVFVYIGDLANTFKYIRNALRNKGLFTFNAEISESEDFKMNQSGRFSHYKNYLDKLAELNQLKVIFYETVVTRLQNNVPVYGHLYVMEACE